MAYQKENPFAPECIDGFNAIAAYQMHIADTYLTLVYILTGQGAMPPLAVLFEEMSNAKWDQAREFLKYLRRREGLIEFPHIERPSIDYLRTPLDAIKHMLMVEERLTMLLGIMRTVARRNNEGHLLQVVDYLLDKQKTTREFLESSILNEKKIEEYNQRKLSENPAENTSPSWSSKEDSSLYSISEPDTRDLDHFHLP